MSVTSPGGSGVVDKFFSDADVSYYTALGIPRNFTPKQLNEAFRRMARLLHPDKNDDVRSADACSLLNSIKETLSNPASRLDYDARLGPIEKSVVINLPVVTPTTKVKDRTKSGLKMIAALLIVACVVGYIEGLDGGHGLSKAEIRKVVRFSQKHGADVLYERMRTLHHRQAFYLPKQWLRERKLDRKARDRIAEICDDLWKEKLIAKCKKQKDQNMARPACLELQRNLQI
jgi:curved DNA-binding protein CbpA